MAIVVKVFGGFSSDSCPWQVARCSSWLLVATARATDVGIYILLELY